MVSNTDRRAFGNDKVSGWMADFAEALPFDAALDSADDAVAYHNAYPWSGPEPIEQRLRKQEERTTCFLLAEWSYPKSRGWTLLLAGGSISPVGTEDEFTAHWQESEWWFSGFSISTVILVDIQHRSSRNARSSGSGLSSFSRAVDAMG